MKVTIKQVLSWRPCKEWTEERMFEASGGKWQMDALEVLRLRRVPVDDRIWLGIKILTESDRRIFPRWIARIVGYVGRIAAHAEARFIAWAAGFEAWSNARAANEIPDAPRDMAWALAWNSIRGEQLAKIRRMIK